MGMVAVNMWEDKIMNISQEKADGVPIEGSEMEYSMNTYPSTADERLTKKDTTQNIRSRIKTTETVSWMDYQTWDCSGGSRQWQHLEAITVRVKMWELTQGKLIKRIRKNLHHYLLIPKN